MTFFVDNINEPIIGDDFLHIKNSLRMKIGDNLNVNCNGFVYKCKIISMDKAIVFDIISKDICKNEPNINVTLYQAMPKGDKFEYIIQKSVELGVSKIVPIETKFTSVNPSNFNKKISRFNKISKEAAKQSNRGIIPEISSVEKLENVLLFLKNNAIIFYEEYFDSKKLNDLTFNLKTNGEKTDVNIIIGSEGGFSKEEIILANSLGIPCIWMGERILRCETAPLAVLSVIMYMTGNL
jgi:16S rRNA (uracil1498-N3)-methyltransferase